MFLLLLTELLRLTRDFGNSEFEPAIAPSGRGLKDSEADPQPAPKHDRLGKMKVLDADARIFMVSGTGAALRGLLKAGRAIRASSPTQ